MSEFFFSKIQVATLSDGSHVFNLILPNDCEITCVTKDHAETCQKEIEAAIDKATGLD